MPATFVHRITCALLLCVAACGGTGAATPEIALTIEVDATVVNSALASIKSLGLHATGSEPYDHVVQLSRALQRDERVVYDASSATRTVTLEIDALDADGRVVASGSVGPLAVSPGRRVDATLTLSTGGADLGQGADLPSSSPDFKRGTYPDTVLADHPLAYYRLDETGGPIASDASGNGRTAQYASTIAYGQAGVLSDDAAITLQADDAWLLTNDAASFSFAGNAPFTLELWIDPPTISDDYHLLFNWDEYPDMLRQHYGIYVSQTDGIVFERTIGDNENSCAAALPAVSVWSHIVGTYDGATLTLYMNGAVVCSAADTRAFTTDTQPLYIGNGGPGWHAIDATFDEAAIYGVALSPERVVAHYQAAQ